MNSVCSSLLPPSNRRRCVKKPTYNETSDALGEIINDDSNYSFNPTDYDYINGESLEDGDEEQVTIDLSDFLNENPLLAEQSTENAAETVDGIDSNSQFRVTSSQVDFNATSNETPLSKSIESEEKSEVDVLSNSVTNCIIADKTTAISDVVDSQLPTEASIKDEISSKENFITKKKIIAKSFIKAKLTKSLSNPLRKYKNFVKTKELSKISHLDTNGLEKYPVVKCEKLNIENLVKENKIKIGNWPLNLINSKNKAKILVSKNGISSKRVSIPKFAVKSTRIFKKPININRKYAPKNKNGSPFNKMNSILVDSFDAMAKSIVINTDVWKPKVGGIYSNSNLLTNFRLPPAQEKSNTKLEQHVKIIGSEGESLVYPMKERKITMISAINKSIEKPKVFQLIAPKQLTKPQDSCVSHDSPKPIIETAVTPPSVNDYTVIEPYVEDPTSPVKPKPILTVPIEIVPTPEPLKQIVSFNVGSHSEKSQIKPLRKPPAFLSSRPKKLQNLCAKFKEKSLIKDSELDVKAHTPAKNISPRKGSLIISNAKDVVVNAMESVFSSNQNHKNPVKTKRNIKKIVETPSVSSPIPSSVCKAYNNTLNDILFGTDDDDPFTELESSFTSIEDFSPVSSEFSSQLIDLSKSNYGQVKTMTEVQNQEKNSIQNVVQMHHKHMKKVKYKRKKSNLPCGSDTLSASEGESKSTVNKNGQKKKIKKSYSKTIENVIKSSSPSKAANSNSDISLTGFSNEKSPGPCIDEEIVNLNSLKATDNSSDLSVDFVENTKPLGLRSRRLSNVPKYSEQIPESSPQKSKRKLDMDNKSQREGSPSKLPQDNKLSSDAGNVSLRKITAKKTKYLHFMSKNRKKPIKRSQVKPTENIRSKVSVKNKSKPQDIIQDIKTITAGSNLSRTRNKKKSVSLCNNSSDDVKADENSFSDSELKSSRNSPKKHCSPRSNSKGKRTLKVLFKPNKRKTVSNCLKLPSNAMNIKLSDANNSSSLSENNENLNSTFRKGKEETMDASSSEPMKNEIDVSVHETKLDGAEIEGKDNIENSESSNEDQDPTTVSTTTSTKPKVDLIADVKLDEIPSENHLSNNMHDKLILVEECSKNTSDLIEKDDSLSLDEKYDEFSKDKNLNPHNCDTKMADSHNSAPEAIQNNDIDTASIIEKSEPPLIDNDENNSSAKSTINETELQENKIITNHQSVSQADCDNPSYINLKDKKNLLEELNSCKNTEFESNNFGMQLQVEENIIENQIVDSEDILRNESNVENKSKPSVQTRSSISLDSQSDVSTTKNNTSERQLCLETESNVLDTLLEKVTKVEEVLENALSQSKENKTAQTENTLKAAPCIDLEAPLSNDSKSTDEKSVSEIQPCISAETFNVSKLDVIKNVSEIGKVSGVQACAHLESSAISEEQSFADEETSDILIKDLKEDSRELKAKTNQLVIRTEVDDTIQAEFGNKPISKKLRRKKCPKLKISVTRDAKSSDGDRSTKNWYVSERKESTDSVLSDISDLGAVKEKSNDKQTIDNRESSPSPKLDSRIDSDTSCAKHFTAANESSELSLHDPAEKQIEFKSVSIKIEPIPSDFDESSEGPKDSAPKASSRKRTKIVVKKESTEEKNAPVVKISKKGSPLKAVKSEPVTQKKEPTTPASHQKARKKNYCPDAVAVPFTLGWVRELVHRANETSSGKRASDVYYFSPDGTKLRSMPDISSYLAKKKDFSLSVQHFTFAKELIYREPFEIERSAKQKSTLSSPSVSTAKKSLQSSTQKPSTSSTSKKSSKISLKKKKTEIVSSCKKITSYLSSDNKNNSSATEESTSNTSFNIKPSSARKRAAAKQIVVKDSPAIDAAENNPKDFSEDDSRSRSSRRITKKIKFDNSLNDTSPVRKKRLSVDDENNTDSLDSNLKTENTAASSKKKGKTLIVKLPIFKKNSQDNILAESPLSKRNDRFSSTPKRSKTVNPIEGELYLMPRCSEFCKLPADQKKQIPTIKCNLCLCNFHESCVAPASENSFICSLCMYKQRTKSTIETFPFCEIPQILDTEAKINAQLFYPEESLIVPTTGSSVNVQKLDAATKLISEVDKRATPLHLQAPVLNSLLTLPSPIPPVPVQNSSELYLDVNTRKLYRKVVVENGRVITPKDNNLQSPANVSLKHQIRPLVHPFATQFSKQAHSVNNYTKQISACSLPRSFPIILNTHVSGNVNSQKIPVPSAITRAPICSVPTSVTQFPISLKTFVAGNVNIQKVPVSATAQVPICSVPSSVPQFPKCLNSFVSGNMSSQNVPVSSATVPNFQLLRPQNSSFTKNISSPCENEALCINDPVLSENSTSVPNSTTKIRSDLCDSDVVKSSLAKSLITYSSSSNLNNNRKRSLENENSKEERPKKLSFLSLEKNVSNQKLDASCSDNIDIPISEGIAKAQDNPASSKSKVSDCDGSNISRSGQFGFAYMFSFFTSYLHFFEVLKRLSLADLLRVKQVSRGWHHMASHNLLYEKINFRGIRVKNWEKCCKAIGRSAISLNFSGIVHDDKAKPWENFKIYLSHLLSVEDMIFDYISPKDIYEIADKMNQLQKLECHFITNHYAKPESSSCELELSFLRVLGRLEWLWLGSPSGIILNKSSQSILPYLPKLKHLTLTGFQFSTHVNLESLSQLQELTTLELGSCLNIEPKIYDLIRALTNLKRLRLENGGSLNDKKLSKAISNMTRLEELELLNYKVPISLPDAVKELQNLKHFSIWPDTSSSSESPQINAVSLDALCKCKKLKNICWGVITEEDKLPDILQLQAKDPNVIKELTFEQLFKKLVEVFPGEKIRIQCVPRNMWGEFCCKRE